MAARVTLEIVKGLLQGRAFAFEERTTCVVGRATDCALQIPAEKHKATISRHHCLLDINPPRIRIRDFGSLNGTYVNGEKIGQRSPEGECDQNVLGSLREVDLRDGDRIVIGGAWIDVHVESDADSALVRVDAGDGGGEADETATVSRQQGGAVNGRQLAEGSASPPEVICEKCGRNIAGELVDSRPGDIVCLACRSDPYELMKLLLQQATTGDAALVAVTGYQICRELGRGGMGAVYLAEHQETGEQVALKVMLPRVAADRRATDSFLRETVNTKALQHPNIVRLFDAGCSRGTFFFTLEYCRGGSVAELLQERGGKLSIDASLNIVLQALEGLCYAHNAEIPYVRLQDGQVVTGIGLVHRDLKPHNIFLDAPSANMVAKLGDYGLAKAFDLAGLSGHTYTGDVAGTPHFMPRQQVLNFRDAGPEVDVWAMAATLYCMLTGSVPRDFTQRKDPWQVVLQTEPLPIRRRESTIPRPLANVIDHALRDQPEIGFKTAADFKLALEQVL